MNTWISLLLVVAFVSQVVHCAPQNNRGSATKETTKQRLTRLLKDPPAPDFKVITLPIVREFFKDKALVKDLVTCFGDIKNCPQKGIKVFIIHLRENYDPAMGCSICGKEFPKVIRLARNRFSKDYKEDWKTLTSYLTDGLRK